MPSFGRVLGIKGTEVPSNLLNNARMREILRCPYIRYIPKNTNIYKKFLYARSVDLFILL